MPLLLQALKSERNDFWARELLSDPISDLRGIEYLPELFDALQKNDDDGHDHDGFCANLIDIAAPKPVECKKRLLELINTNGFKHKESAKWLLDFCE